MTADESRLTGPAPARASASTTKRKSALIATTPTHASVTVLQGRCAVSVPEEEPVHRAHRPGEVTSGVDQPPVPVLEAVSKQAGDDH